MKTVLQVLYILSDHGWRQKLHVGRCRVLAHPDRPGVYIYLFGRPSKSLWPADVKRILALAGISEGP